MGGMNRYIVSEVEAWLRERYASTVAKEGVPDAGNRGSRHKPKWSGFAKYKGRRKWIGTHDNMEESTAKPRNDA